MEAYLFYFSVALGLAALGRSLAARRCLTAAAPLGRSLVARRRLTAAAPLPAEHGL